MKIVLFSDLHLDSAFAWMHGTPEAARKRRQALWNTLEKIIDLTEEVGADVLLCGGDLYENERVAPDTGASLKSAFGRLSPVRVFIAPGNHDWYGPQSVYRGTDWTSNVHVFSETKLTSVELDDGLTLWGGAHRRPAGTSGFLESFRVDRGGIHLALFHGSANAWLGEQEEGKQPHAPFSVSQIERSGLHHAFLGHFHRPHDHELFTYPGNPDPLAFGEDGERGAVIVTVKGDGNLIRERRAVAVSQVHDLVVDVSGAESLQELRRKVRQELESLVGYARIRIEGDIAADIAAAPRDFDTVQSSLDCMTISIGNLRGAYDLDAIKQELTVRGEFVRSVLNAGMSVEEEKRVLITGLRALEGRDDLEVT